MISSARGGDRETSSLLSISVSLHQSLALSLAGPNGRGAAMQNTLTDSSHLNSIRHGTDGCVYSRHAARARAGEGGGRGALSLCVALVRCVVAALLSVWD